MCLYYLFVPLFMLDISKSLQFIAFKLNLDCVSIKIYTKKSNQKQKQKQKNHYENNEIEKKNNSKITVSKKKKKMNT